MICEPGRLEVLQKDSPARRIEKRAKKTPRDSRRDLCSVSNFRPKSQIEMEVAYIIELIIHPFG